MKVKYEFVNGEVSEIKVDDSLGELLVEMDRQEYNINHKETRRCSSVKTAGTKSVLRGTTPPMAARKSRESTSATFTTAHLT